MNNTNIDIQEMMRGYMEAQVNSRLAVFRKLNAYVQKGQTVLVGSSLMEQFPVNELLMDAGLPHIVYNRGIGGTVSAQLLANLEDQVLNLEPARLFINIGTNDLALPGDYLTPLIENYRAILQAVKQRLPGCAIYMMAYYPVADVDQLPVKPPEGMPLRTNAMVDEANALLPALAAEQGCTLLDVNHVLRDERGYLRADYAADLVHLLPNAYYAVLQELLPYF